MRVVEMEEILFGALEGLREAYRDAFEEAERIRLLGGSKEAEQEARRTNRRLTEAAALVGQAINKLRGL